MNKLNNIVVENLSLEFGQELKKTFEELGVDTREYIFSHNKEMGYESRFYGLINCYKFNNYIFNNYTLNQVKNANAKIITLEQLKAMKRQNEYPKMMYVSDEPIKSEKDVYKTIVYFEKEIDGENYYFSKCINLGFVSYNYAVDVDYFEKQVKEITIEDILTECKEAIESKFGKLETIKIK